MPTQGPPGTGLPAAPGGYQWAQDRFGSWLLRDDRTGELLEWNRDPTTGAVFPKLPGGPGQEPVVQPPPAAQPPLGGGGGGGGTVVPEDVQEDFLRQAGLAGLRKSGYNPEGAFGGYLKQRIPSAIGAYTAENFLRGGRGEPVLTDFEGYAQNLLPGGTSPVGLKAGDLFRQLETAPLAQENTRTALRGVTAENEEIGGAQNIRSRIQALAQAAARQQFGAYAAKFLPSGDQLTDRFSRALYEREAAGATTPGTPGVDYLAFLRKQFGLR